MPKILVKKSNPLKGSVKIETDKAPTKRLLPNPNTNKKIKYPNNPTTMDGNDESVSIQILRNLVIGPFFAYTAR